MPSLKTDNSIQATVWRGFTGNGEFDVNKLKSNNFSLGSSRTFNRVNFNLPTVVGIRDGIPWGQDQLDGVMRKRQLDPYPTAKSPFLSNNIEDIAPRTYATNPIAGTGGELTNLSSMGGTPLAIALDDQTALTQRVHTESMRSDPRNPLSAEFAWRAYMQQGEHPEKGPMADAQREQMGADEDEAAVIKSRIAKGYGETQRLSHEDHQRAQAILERDHEPTSGDIMQLKDLFKANFLPTEKNNNAFLNDMSNYFRDHVKHSAHQNFTTATTEGVQQPLIAPPQAQQVGIDPIMSDPVMGYVHGSAEHFRRLLTPTAGSTTRQSISDISHADIFPDRDSHFSGGAARALSFQSPGSAARPLSFQSPESQGSARGTLFQRHTAAMARQGGIPRQTPRTPSAARQQTEDEDRMRQMLSSPAPTSATQDARRISLSDRVQRQRHPMHLRSMGP